MQSAKNCDDLAAKNERLKNQTCRRLCQDQDSLPRESPRMFAKPSSTRTFADQFNSVRALSDGNAILLVNSSISISRCCTAWPERLPMIAASSAVECNTPVPK